MERGLLEVELHCKSFFAASTIGIVWPGGHIGMKKRHQLLLFIEIDSMVRNQGSSSFEENWGDSETTSQTNGGVICPDYMAFKFNMCVPENYLILRGNVFLSEWV